MRRKKITSDDILKGHYIAQKKVHLLPKMPTQKMSIFERLYISIGLVVVLFLSCSFFFPQVIKETDLFMLFCIFVACAASVHLMFLVCLTDVAFTADAVIEILFRILAELLAGLF